MFLPDDRYLRKSFHSYKLEDLTYILEPVPWKWGFPFHLLLLIQGLFKVKRIFIKILKCHLFFTLHSLVSPKEFSRTSMMWNDIITALPNGM